VPEEKWNMERIRDEVYEARTKMFVVVKVLETVNIKPREYPEWTLVIKPLLKDLIENTEKIQALIEEEKPPAQA
jgi:hypothetical protein